MVVGIGIDLLEIERVERALQRWGERIVARLMDPPEAARLPTVLADRARALALAIAGKEAASKAIGTGWTRGVRWRDVDVDIAAPGATLRAAALVRARSLGSDGRGRLRLEVRGSLVVAEYWLLDAEGRG